MTEACQKWKDGLLALMEVFYRSLGVNILDYPPWCYEFVCTWMPNRYHTRMCPVDGHYP
jgi:hypothetical protein